MKLWVDDVRPAPEGYEWDSSVNDAMITIICAERRAASCRGMIEASQSPDRIARWKEILAENIIELIDIDHDAGEYANDGGDYIKLLDWLEETGRNYPIRIHSMNPVGVENMRRIIERNGWTEVK